MYPELCCADIFNAAKEALNLGNHVQPDQKQLDNLRRQAIQQQNRWSEKDEQELVVMFTSGECIDKIAQKLHRSSKAVRARLQKLGMLTSLNGCSEIPRVMVQRIR
jgi:DNA-binding NarL/FixJ family response regulator